MLKKLTYIIIFLAFSINIFSQEENLEYEVITDDLFSPWEITEGPDGWLWYTERIGLIWRLNPDTGEKVQLTKLDSVYNRFERGLLGMAVHPEFDKKPYVYAVYTTKLSDEPDDFENRLIRLKYDFENDTLIEYERHLVTNGAGIHNGSRLKFGPNGYLYMTMGDNRLWDNAPLIDNFEGKILRMDEDCNPVKSNPFFGQGNDSTDYLYSIGHRNPQGLVFVGNRLFNSEHGPKTDDEVNEIIKGRHYGWPEVRGFCDSDNDHEINFCQKWNVKEPLFAWTPTVATSGLEFYNGGRYKDWNNSFLVATLKDNTIHRMKMNNDLTEVIDTSQHFKKEFGRIRDFAISKDEQIYFITGKMDSEYDPNADRQDLLIRIVPNSTNVDLRIKQKSILIYPNPVKYIANIRSEKKIHTLELFNPIGQSVYKKNNVNTYKETIEISAYQSGSYMLVIGLGNERYVNKKIMID